MFLAIVPINVDVVMTMMKVMAMKMVLAMMATMYGSVVYDVQNNVGGENGG